MKRLFKQYENVVANLRTECTRLIEKHLKKAVSGIKFKESVYLHFVSDNVNTNLERIDLDGTLYVTFSLTYNGFTEVMTYGLEELDAAGLYELLLAFKEKKFEVV